MKTIEEWKDIPDYEGYYMVSDRGKVRSLPRIITRIDGVRKSIKGGLLKGGYGEFEKGNDRYLFYSLCKDNKHSTFGIGILMLTAFDRIPQPGYEAHFLGGNGLLLESWEWRLQNPGDYNKERRKLSEENVRIIRTSQKTYAALAKEFGVSEGLIKNIRTFTAYKDLGFERSKRIPTNHHKTGRFYWSD